MFSTHMFFAINTQFINDSKIMHVFSQFFVDSLGSVDIDIDPSDSKSHTHIHFIYRVRYITHTYVLAMETMGPEPCPGPRAAWVGPSPLMGSFGS